MSENTISRRNFIKAAGAGACACGMGLWPSAGCGAEFDEADIKEIRFYTPLDGGRIRCDVCPRLCQIADLERGYCGNKENRKGKYYSLVYSRPCTVHVDPIEKKPLFHVLPGSQAFSIATAGCNIECDFCQNWQIAQFRPEQVPSIRLTPEQAARKAKETGCSTIAYTYSEPVTFYDYMLDTAVEGKKKGVGSVVITNGFINEAPLRLLCENVTAVKIDLKAFTEKFYQKSCHGELKPVKDTLVRLVRWGMWTEIVVLIIPTLNDSPDEIRAMVEWISGELSPDVPVHFTRFHGAYKIKNLPPTPLSTLERCYEIAKEKGLKYVYLGNVPGHPSENTRCPKCDKIVVKRTGFIVSEINIKKGRCEFCEEVIPGVWDL